MKIQVRSIFAFCSLILIIIGCTIFSGDEIEIAGYVKDVTTGLTLNGYTVIVETAGDKESVDVDTDTGKFSFSIPVGADYIVYVTLTGYRNFKSSNQARFVSTEDHEVNVNQAMMYNVPLIPETVNTPAVNVLVVDKNSGATIATGAYRVVATTAATAYEPSIYDDGTTTTGLPYWLPDSEPIAGAVQTGAFTIAANTLLPFLDYKITVFGVSGYRDNSVTLTNPTGAIDTTPYQTVELTPLAQSGALTLVGQSHVGLAGDPIPITSRTIVFTFDRTIEMNKDDLKGKGLENFLTISSEDSDEDGNETEEVVETEIVPPFTYSDLVQVSSSANLLSITIPSSDDDIINGSIDTDDHLEYLMNIDDDDSFLNNIKIRDANYPWEGGAATWTALKDIAGIERTILIRAQD